MRCSSVTRVAVMRGALLSAVMLALCNGARAGSTVIGELFPPPMTQVTSTVSGVAIDGQGGALILEGRGNIKRVSTSNASVLGTVVTLSSGVYRSSLEHRSSTGQFFTTRPMSVAPFHERLYSISSSGAETLVGSTGGIWSFPSLALDSSENLWGMSAADIYNQSSVTPALYTIDKTTGLATFATVINVPQFQQLHALGIDEGNQFFVTSADNIYQVNPASGAATLVTTTGLPFQSHFSDLAFDRTTDKWYGVESRRATNPDTYFLREITGMPPVPEPAAVSLLAAAAIGLRRHRRDL